ncbi:MAG: DedA family protein [Bacteriovoracaceae bacterium]|nr:DedA family protein [Bacteriovoracaceae bacterium]
MVIPITWGLIGLFFTSFLAATFLPFGSEPYIVYMLRQPDANSTIIIAVATIGNFLGSVLTYYMGRLLPLKKAQSYLKISDNSVEKSIKLSEKYGPILGFFVFFPIIGDAIALVLGFLRTPVLPVFIAIFLGKLVRYLGIAFFIYYF